MKERSKDEGTFVMRDVPPIEKGRLDMTPPDANLEKQERRNRPDLYLVVLAIVVFVMGGLLLLQTPVVPEVRDETAIQADDS
jgi:hypothetical protein